MTSERWNVVWSWKTNCTKSFLLFLYYKKKKINWMADRVTGDEEKLARLVSKPSCVWDAGHRLQQVNKERSSIVVKRFNFTPSPLPPLYSSLQPYPLSSSKCHNWWHNNTYDFHGCKKKKKKERKKKTNKQTKKNITIIKKKHNEVMVWALWWVQVSYRE